MTNQEIAWVAGILEGEGCFDGNGTGKNPRVRVELKDHDVIERLHALIGGKISYPKQRNPGKWSATALLSVCGRAEVEPLLRAIRPWMSERRGEKVDELLEIWD